MPRPPLIRILAERCLRCGQCADICPEGAIIQKQPNSLPRIPRPSKCISCGHCVSICPVGAVMHSDFPEDAA